MRRGLRDGLPNVQRPNVQSPNFQSLDKEMRAAMQEGLQEAIAEIREDEDLRRMGLTDDVEKLVRSMLGGQGGQEDFAKGLQGVIGKGDAGRPARGEDRDPQRPGPQRMGISDDVEKLVESILGGNAQFEGALGNIIQQAMQEGLREAKTEIRNDPELKELGISRDVEGLVESILGGKGDFEGSLTRIIEKAMATEAKKERAKVATAARSGRSWGWGRKEGIGRRAPGPRLGRNKARRPATGADASPQNSLENRKRTETLKTASPGCGPDRMHATTTRLWDCGSCRYRNAAKPFSGFRSFCGFQAVLGDAPTSLAPPSPVVTPQPQPVVPARFFLGQSVG